MATRPKAISAPGGTGYSGTPLPAKLGLKSGFRAIALNPPPHLSALLADAPADIEWLNKLAQFDLALAFVTDRNALVSELERLAPKLIDTGMIWFAWPKKASGVITDLTEDVVRTEGLAAGLVDVKVCAIDATWSGLKFVRRLRDRGAKTPPRR